MKRVLVFSDSHGNKRGVDRLMERIDEFDKVIFLGDGWRDVEDYQAIYPSKFEVVRGNCDDRWTCDMPDHLVLSIEGVRFYVLHGHTCAAKSRTDLMCAAATVAECSVVLYGHTHRAKDEYGAYAVRLINPGHLGQPESNASWAELTVANGEIFAKFQNFA